MCLCNYSSVSISPFPSFLLSFLSLPLFYSCLLFPLPSSLLSLPPHLHPLPPFLPASLLPSFLLSYFPSLNPSLLFSQTRSFPFSLSSQSPFSGIFEEFRSETFNQNGFCRIINSKSAFARGWEEDNVQLLKWIWMNHRFWLLSSLFFYEHFVTIQKQQQQNQMSCSGKA